MFVGLEGLYLCLSIEIFFFDSPDVCKEEFVRLLCLRFTSCLLKFWGLRRLFRILLVAGLARFCFCLNWLYWFYWLFDLNFLLFSFLDDVGGRDLIRCLLFFLFLFFLFWLNFVLFHWFQFFFLGVFLQDVILLNDRLFIVPFHLPYFLLLLAYFLGQIFQAMLVHFITCF